MRRFLERQSIQYAFIGVFAVIAAITTVELAYHAGIHITQKKDSADTMMSITVLSAAADNNQQKSTPPAVSFTVLPRLLTMSDCRKSMEPLARKIEAASGVHEGSFVSHNEASARLVSGKLSIVTECI